nr:DUF4190 domain-containing protein [Streptomyces sp. NBC_00974]
MTNTAQKTEREMELQTETETETETETGAGAGNVPTRTASTGTAGADPHPRGPQDSGYGIRPPAGRNGLAETASVLGAVGLTTSIVFIGGPLGVVGLMFGLAALKTSRRTGTGRGKAVTGVVTSSLAIVVSVLVAVFMVWYANHTQECYRTDSFQQYRQCVHQQLTGD